MSKLRWAKLWWSDYENDPALRLCSLAAQGLWMRLLCLAASSRVYGHVLVGGEVPSVAQIARIVGDHHVRVAALIRELERHKVLARSEQGAIISKRMIADFAEHHRNSTAGKLGGNPQLLPDHGPPPNGGMSQRPLKPTLKAEEEEEVKRKNPPVGPREAGADADGDEIFGGSRKAGTNPRAMGTNPRAVERYPRRRRSRNGMIDLILDEMEEANAEADDARRDSARVVSIVGRLNRGNDDP